MGSFNRFDPSQNTQKISPLAISTISITLTYNLFLFYILQPTISNGPQTFKFHTETNNGIAYGKTGFAFLNFSVSSIVLALLSTVSVSRPLCLASFILACCSSLSFFPSVSPSLSELFRPFDFFSLISKTGFSFASLHTTSITLEFLNAVLPEIISDMFYVMRVSISLLSYSTIYVICRLRV